MSVQDIASLIMETRKKNRISQSEFGRICSLSAGTIGKLELAAVKPDTETLIKLAHGLKMRPEELLRIYQGLPPESEKDNAHSLPYEIRMIAADGDLDWRHLSPESREAITSAIRLVARIEKERAKHQLPAGGKRH